MEIPFSFKLQKNGSTATTTREAFLPFLSGEKCGMGIFLKYFFSIVPSFHLQWWSYAVKKTFLHEKRPKFFIPTWWQVGQSGQFCANPTKEHIKIKKILKEKLVALSSGLYSISITHSKPSETHFHRNFFLTVQSKFLNPSFVWNSF